MSASDRAVEDAARHGYGRIVARLAARTGDIPAAEEHVAEAFELALKTWPRDGIPRVPEAWLLAVAKRRHIDEWRRLEAARKSVTDLEVLRGDSHTGPDEAVGKMEDERLKLLFAVAHPAIDASVHTALMLQTVLGLDAARIASAYMIAPSTMAQRLVRAKQKIRSDGVPFVVPEEEELAARLVPVMGAIYAAFGLAWELPGASGDGLDELAPEAIWLARVLSELLPSEPEPKGLLALMIYAHARRAARVDSNGVLVPLTEQDTTLWNGAAIGEAEQLLRQASVAGRPGRYQLEAAVQSVYSSRIVGLPIDWSAAVFLQEALQAAHPTVGGQVALAASVGLGRGPGNGLEVLDAVSDALVNTYQPYWAVRAELLAALPERRNEARQAYARAIGLSVKPAERFWLIARSRLLDD